MNNLLSDSIKKMIMNNHPDTVLLFGGTPPNKTKKNKYNFVCTNCRNVMKYIHDWYAMYCESCQITNFDGMFIIDQTTAVNRPVNWYNPLDTFDKWINQIFHYKNTIPREVIDDILKKYDSQKWTPLCGAQQTIASSGVFKQIL